MKKLITFALCFLCLCGCQKNNKHTVEYYEYFDTLISVTFYADQKDVANIEQTIEFTLKYYHKLFDRYNEYPGVTNIYTISKYPSRLHSIDPKLYDILRFGYENFYTSGENVNIAAGALLSLWHDSREEGTTIPSQADIDYALKHINIENLHLEKDSVILEDSKMSLDLGAIAKGYVTDELYLALKESGAKAGFINMGGNIFCFGAPSNRDYFIAGIQSPFEDDIFAKVKILDASLVTSGDYQRYYTVDGVDYHHILDLETGYPKGEFKSVTVYHGSSKIADLLSTSLFLSSYEEGLAILKEYDAEALWILPNGDSLMSDGFPIIE